MKRTVNVLSRLNWGTRACAVLALCATTAIALPAQTLTTLYSFCSQGGCTDGDYPRAGLVQTTNGDLYGTTAAGGANRLGGTVFKITPGGTLTTLYSFCSQTNCTDGSNSFAGLVQAANGDLYGTTGDGGANGYGAVFKITPSGTLTSLYNFCPQTNCTDGAGPQAGLVQAANGNLYGTTSSYPFNTGGTIFKITPSGTLTTLYSFCSQSGCTDGEGPRAGLVQATNGDFYGTTDGGGSNNGGTVFKITPSGTLTTLYTFCSQSGCTDGASPNAGLVQDTNGDFYGTTANGGPNGYGTVFKITPSGTLTTLHIFCSQTNCTDGQYPVAGLVQAANGDLYGTTSSGWSNNGGTVFKITPSGTLTTLFTFCSQSGCTDGASPNAGLVQDTNGDFYGTTYGGIGRGGPANGTVFRLSVGLGPFVKPRPPYGKVGAAIKILGTNLTGAASVSFNGTAAVFTVVSPSLITTTVPAGASSGKVQVVTPGGTLSSNASFLVVP